MFLRIIVSCELQRRQDFFLPFVMVTSLPVPLQLLQYLSNELDSMAPKNGHPPEYGIQICLQARIQYRFTYWQSYQMLFSGKADEENFHMVAWYSCVWLMDMLSFSSCYHQSLEILDIGSQLELRQFERKSYRLSWVLKI